MKREKERDLTQSYYKSTYIHRKIQKCKRDNIKKATKTSITQRLGTDLGRSAGITTTTTGVVKPVYEQSTFPLTTTAVLSRGHTFKNL